MKRDTNAYGYTFFYTLRFGKDVSGERQTRRFSLGKGEETLAVARVTFDGGEIEVIFGLVAGVLFSLKHRSPQNVYYPFGAYKIESLVVWPKP